MQIEDLTVEVRDTTKTRVGLLTPADLVGAKFLSKFNNVGTWTVVLPYGHVLADVLRSPGSGIIVTGPDGVLLSGPTVQAELAQTVEDPAGTWTITGVDDSVVLADSLGYPSPGVSDVAAQTVANDIRTGSAETVLKQYVNYNIGPAATTARKVANLTIEADANRGNAVTGSARFESLQDLFYPLAQTGGIGYTVEQVGSDLQFQVYVPQNRTSTIRMDLQNGKLSKTDYAYVSPKLTRAIVGGQGESVERIFYEATSTDSVGAETLWGRRIETFIDSRNTSLTTELQQAGEEALVDKGKTIVNLSVVPSDDVNMRYGYDWGLGDEVSVIIGDIEASATVTEVAIGVESDGVRVIATVGTPTPLSFESKLISASQSQAVRISNLERNTTGYGVSTSYQPGGGTNGTQPVFPPTAIVGSYTRFGNMVHFAIKVTFTSITNFGTGRYYLTLPYNTAHAYFMREGCLHDASAGTTYPIGGHLNEGSNVLELYSMDKVSSGVQDVAFTSTYPVTLATADSFHISGTYEIEV